MQDDTTLRARLNRNHLPEGEGTMRSMAERVSSREREDSACGYSLHHRLRRRSPSPSGGGVGRGRSLRYPDALDFPFELDTGPCHLGADFFAEGFDVGAGCFAQVEQEVAVLFRHLRIAPAQATAAGGVDEGPRLIAFGILKVEPPVRERAAAARLRAQRRYGPSRRRSLRITGRALEQRLDDDCAGGNVRVAVGVAELLRRPVRRFAVTQRRRRPLPGCP